MTKEKILIRLFVNGHINGDELKTLCMDEVFVPHFTTDVPPVNPPEHLYAPNQVKYENSGTPWFHNTGTSSGDLKVTCSTS